MSEAAAKATRRDLRRAIGPVALEAINEQGRQIARQAIMLEAQAVRLDALQTQAIQDRDAARVMLGWSLRQRLSWLLLGRA